MTRRVGIYYLWYPFQWEDAGHRFNSVLGEYDSGNQYAIDTHIMQMQGAHMDGALASWFPPGDKVMADERMRALLDVAAGFEIGLYYEPDFDGKRTLGQIAEDMFYLRENYFNDPSFMKIDGKPVVFVYAPSIPDNSEASHAFLHKWEQVRDVFGLYVNMSDVPYWWERNTMDSWHRYEPAQRVKAVNYFSTVYSFSISAGFHAAWENQARLVRDPADFERMVKGVKYFDPEWEVYFFNEFGEGSQIEETAEHGTTYLDILARNPPEAS